VNPFILLFGIAFGIAAEPSVREVGKPTAVPCEEAPERMSCIPGGEFIRGTDDGPKNARPAERVWLQTFYMDKYEVTYSEYRACRKEEKCPYGGPAYSDFDRAAQPIVGVSWFAARDYCRAAGKHLPTEAEWEKAARGPDGNVYPWGNEPATCDRAVIEDASGKGCGTRKKPPDPEKGRTLEVGSRPAGAYGLFDMAGNSWEWVQDWYSASYGHCGGACQGVDPKGPCAGREQCKGHDQKIVRGDSWYWDGFHATGYYRRPHYPNNKPFHHFGFRCAASVGEAQKLREHAALPNHLALFADRVHAAVALKAHGLGFAAALAR